MSESPDSLPWAALSVEPNPLCTAQYDVAISFAGEQRREAEGIAARLRAAGVSVFYDAYEPADLWGKNLQDHLARLEGHTESLLQAAFSPDGQRIVTASRDRTARVWNAGNGQLLAKLEGHTGDVSHAVFSPDGQLIVTASWDRTARVWNAGNGQLLAKLEGHTGDVSQAAF